MGSRSSLAAVLSILLLSMSSWTPACDLSCSLQPVHSECHAAKANRADEHKAEPTPPKLAMPQGHCAHMSKPESDIRTGIEHLLAVSSCAHEPCSQTSTSASAMSGIDRTQVKKGHSVVVSTVYLAESSTHLRRIQGEAPHTAIRTIDPLSVILRI
jgi:hypothetical protein